MRKKELKDYMSLKYRINLRPLSEEDGGGWLAEAVELPGCMSDGETPEEAIRNLEGAKEAWLAVSLEKGYPVPVPAVESEPEYNGRITVRLPKSLHRKIAETAKNDGMSLNSYLLYLVSENHASTVANKALQICQKAMSTREDQYFSLIMKMSSRKQKSRDTRDGIVIPFTAYGKGGACFAATQQKDCQ